MHFIINDLNEIPLKDYANLMMEYCYIRWYPMYAYIYLMNNKNIYEKMKNEKTL